MLTLVFAFLWLPDGTVDAAVRSPRGVEITAKFPDTEPGMIDFVRWIAREVNFTEESVAHSCLAAAQGDVVGIGTSPFLELAYDGTANTFIWSEQHVQMTFSSGSPAERTALIMLRTCALEHGIV